MGLEIDTTSIFLTTKLSEYMARNKGVLNPKKQNRRYKF